MASKAYEGQYKAYLLSVQPAGFDPEAGSTITQAELNAGTRLLRLVSDGAVAMTFTTNTASQALVDLGKVSHNIGTREVTGVSVTHEIDFPLATDTMWNLYNYGDKRWLVIAPDGVPTADGDVLHIFEVETGEVQPQGSARDTKQNFMVVFAVQDWDLNAVFDVP